MKILMVSIFSSHFFNWTEQLKNTDHEIWWLDVFDSNTKVQKIDFVEQITGWRYRKNFKGRYYLKNNFPRITNLINKVNERDFIKVFEKTINEIRPDVVHSFVMYLSAAPILPIMKKYPGIKWIYSSWGSDLYYYGKIDEYKKDIHKTLPCIDYLLTDCRRDAELARKMGFKGEFLGVFPGGGGFDLGYWEKYMMPLGKRKLILIKGYEGLHGRSSAVIKALKELEPLKNDLRVVVFGGTKDLLKKLKNIELTQNWEIKEKISHHEVMQLMGRSLIYIGNSLSDGIPNTCLEAIVMGAFPIQSNPGGATSEIIEHGRNGFLIEEPENIAKISELIKTAVEDHELILRAQTINKKENIPQLEREVVARKVISKYKIVEEKIKSEN